VPGCADADAAACGNEVFRQWQHAHDARLRSRPVCFGPTEADDSLLLKKLHLAMLHTVDCPPLGFGRAQQVQLAEDFVGGFNINLGILGQLAKPGLPPNDVGAILKARAVLKTASCASNRNVFAAVLRSVTYC
jgi:hypothetical protein